jgi:G:T-mismatch repair DNA endonuclease (very short patch repair protein)
MATTAVTAATEANAINPAARAAATAGANAATRATPASTASCEPGGDDPKGDSPPPSSGGSPRQINSWITNAASPQDVLSVLTAYLHALNHIHVSTAFNVLGKMAKDFSPQVLTADEGFQALLRLTRDFAENRKLDTQAVANATHGIAKLHEAGRLGGSVDDTLVALEIDAVRVAPKMNSQNVANTVYAYSVLGRTPGDETRAALEAAVRRVAPDMQPQHVSNTVWGYATLKRMSGGQGYLGDETWTALEAAAVRVAPDMIPQNLSNLVWGFSTLGRMPRDETWAALEAAAGRVARGLKPQELANLVWGYAKLGRMPGDKTWTALDAAAGRVAPGMISQNLANTVLSYATLGRMPGDETWAALDAAAGRVAPGMESQGLANLVWGYAALSTLRDVELPSCHAAVWDRVCGLEARDFNHEQLCMLFQAHLMHNSSDASPSLAYPAWLMKEARDAWRRDVRDDNTVSDAQRDLARVFGELGVKHQVARVTDDGYFSTDIYLPEHDVAVEFGCYWHYYHDSTDSSSSSSRDASMTKTAKTELRDFFLAKQCAKVVTVPYYEFDRVRHSPEKLRLYVKEKLAKEAGVTSRLIGAARPPILWREPARPR